MNITLPSKLMILMSFALATVCCAVVRSNAAEAEFKQLNLGDRVVTNAYVTSATPVEVVVMWESGGKTFKRAEMPPALKERYPFDAAKAAAFLKEHETEREKRLQETKQRQQRANLELKSTLLGQRLSLKQRVAVLEKDLARVHAQTDASRPRFRRRLSAAEHQDLERLTMRQRELRGQIDEFNERVSSIDTQLAAIP